MSLPSLPSRNKELSGGVTLDIGVYTVQFVSLMMGGDKPLKVISGGHLHPQVSSGLYWVASHTMSNSHIANDDDLLITKKYTYCICTV